MPRPDVNAASLGVAAPPPAASGKKRTIMIGRKMISFSDLYFALLTMLANSCFRKDSFRFHPALLNNYLYNKAFFNKCHTRGATRATRHHF